MASPRVGFGLPARPTDERFRRRIDDTKAATGLPRPITRNAEKEAETSKSTKQVPSQTKLPSRVPLPSSTRRPSITQPTPQPTLKPVHDRQSKSWGSTTSSSSYSKSHSQTGSGSSSSSRSYDGNSRSGQHVLRRKKSSLSQDTGGQRNDSSSLNSSPRRQSRGMVDSALGIQYDREMTESPFEIQMDEPAEPYKPTTQPPIIYPELDRYRHFERPQNMFNRQYVDVPYRLATHDLPPPTPGSLFSANSSQISALSGSPSTKFSESPGPGSYSRDTTPTSISSQSPGLIAPSRVFPLTKTRHHSPSLTRPPVTRRRTGSISNEMDLISVDPHGLAAVRESLASSSSSSTVKDGDRNSKKGRKTGKALAPPPPSPPPRKSSQKFHKTKSDEESSPKQRRKPEKQATPEASLQPKPSARPQPLQLSPPKGTRPSRPSRDGTPNIKSQLFSPIPVIQSNLVPRSAPTERRGSESAIPSSLTNPASQVNQPNKSALTSHLPATGEAIRLDELTDSKKTGASNPPRPSATPSPNVGSSSRGRFPFFGRKKATTENSQDDKKDQKKPARKGPAAGTGHEGYGRIGAVRRRSGSFASATRTFTETKLSQESLISNDSFLADRINPVIIAGGEVIENRNGSSELNRSESNQSLLYYGRPSTDSNAIMLSASRNGSSMTLWPSAIPRGSNTAPTSRRPSDSSDSSGVAMKSTIAFRRSVQRLRMSPDNPLRLPQPINTSGVASSPMTSFDTSVMSDESSLPDLQLRISHESSNQQSAPKKLKKRARSPRKWNIFGRSQSQPKPEKKNEKVTVTVKPVEKKPVPFYAIMDSPEQDDELLDVREVLRDADVYNNSRSKLNTPELQPSEFRNLNVSQLSVTASPQLSQNDKHRENAIPEPPAPRTEIPMPAAITLSSGRPSRLPQVGRIPQVVSNRQERPSALSFSRPFGADVQPLGRALDIYDASSAVRVPNVNKPATPIPDPTRDGSATDCGTEFSFYGESTSHFTPEPPAVKEFLSFSPRKNSDCTTDTSSSTSAMYNYAEATAVIPKPDDPLVEDEVWDEYNDLLGDDAKGPQSATSSKGIPFHLETYQNKLTRGKPMESPTFVMDSRKVSTLSEALTASTTFSADMTERIRAAFQPHPSPKAPLPVPDLEQQSNKRNSGTQSMSETRLSTTSQRSRQSSSSSSSEEWSPLAQVNLRVGSMTVSKWLTFGHVLFSDIRHELIRDTDSLKRPSILVVDGLGNDDWSFYAAETYPAANFFNLSPRAPLPADLQNSPSGYPLSPPNHHQIQYVSHLDKFPFAPQSFACVVYRFPIAAPESHYRNIISEARRVLKPDGYIEMSILDVDLNNMGNRGRRTVRQLKERIHEKTPETNLASTADLMVRLLGRGGYTKIKAARVGVPVASSITPSNNDGAQDKHSTEKKKKVKDQPSLAEMMRDQSPTADEGITSMVARVGRWWYSRCYENAAGSSTGKKKSIWNDKALLHECEELGTSLKLMVCCARAPERINSV